MGLLTSLLCQVDGAMTASFASVKEAIELGEELQGRCEYLLREVCGVRDVPRRDSDVGRPLSRLGNQDELMW